MPKTIHEAQCGLCRQIKTLQNSHLIPRSIYSLASKAFPEQAGLLSVVSHRGMHNLSKQTTKYFLCDECEAVFDKLGENIVVKELCKIKDDTATFALLNKLNSLPGQFTSDKSTECYFFDNNDLININAYTHFALGIIWKMSATKWRGKPFEAYYNILGNHYEEQIRSYLLTEDQRFLSNIHIICLVDNKVNSYPWILFPYVKKNKNFGHVYTFIVPGVKFIVYIGKNNIPVFFELFKKSHICFGKTDLDNDSDFIANIRLIKEIC